MKRLLVACCILLVSPAFCQTDYNQVMDMYFKVMYGQIPLENLTQEQKRQFYTVYKIMNSYTESNGTEECDDALEKAKRKASELSSASSSLKSCAESKNLKDDCSSYFYSVQSDHDDYERAVRQVKSECD